MSVSTRARRTWVFVLACFAVSGATGLVLEIVWVRMLTQVFGSSTLAISTVLGTFMAGLGLGSFVGGRLADRIRVHPLWAYAACEVGVAVTALLVPLVILGVPSANAFLWRALGGAPLLLALARFVLCALLLFAPTFFMGATLPILSRFAIASDANLDHLGRRVAALYAINTAGALIGAFSAGIWLLPALGTHALQYTAIGAALAVASVAAAFAFRAGPTVGASPALEARRSTAPQNPSDGLLALAAFGLSGAVAMTMEVLFSRAMALVLGSAIQSFTLVLVLFLLGISVGAATMGRLATRSSDPLGWLAIALAGVGAATLFALFRLEGLPQLYFDLVNATTSELDSASGIAIRSLVVGTIAPVTFFLGAVMPLAVRAYARAASSVGADVGTAYMANTVGAVIGSVAGGFVVLPLFGLKQGLLLCAALPMAAAVIVASRAQSRRLDWGTRIVVAALVPLAFVATRVDLTVLSWGQYQNVSAEKYQGAAKDHKLAFYRDGRSSTVTVIRSKGNVLSLLNNGKPDGSTYEDDTRMQVMLGMIPALLHEGDEADALVIGYGTGMTVGAMAMAPNVKRVDTVELEEAVYDAADRFFGPFNREAASNPKVHRFVGDGRNFLAARGGRYDIIVSEPPNPWVAGVANLFSDEFYKLARRHMSEQGVFCQWVQLYYIRPETVRRMYRTFQRSFRNVVVFRVNPFESILIGSNQRLQFDNEVIGARMNDAEARRELVRAALHAPPSLRALVALTPPELIDYVGTGDIYSDDNGRLEFDAQSDYFYAVRSEDNRRALYEAWTREFDGYGDLTTLTQ